MAYKLEAGDDCPQCKKKGNKGMMKNAGTTVKGGVEYEVLKCTYCDWKYRKE